MLEVPAELGIGNCVKGRRGGGRRVVGGSAGGPHDLFRPGGYLCQSDADGCRHPASPRGASDSEKQRQIHSMMENVCVATAGRYFTCPVNEFQSAAAWENSTVLRPFTWEGTLGILDLSFCWIARGATQASTRLE